MSKSAFSASTSTRATRSEPLLSRLASLPADLALALTEAAAVAYADWEAELGGLAALLLNAACLVALALGARSDTDADDIDSERIGLRRSSSSSGTTSLLSQLFFGRTLGTGGGVVFEDEDAYDNLSVFSQLVRFLFSAHTLQLILLFTSVYNAYILFTSSRSYSLFAETDQMNVQSPNARVEELETEDGEDYDDENADDDEGFEKPVTFWARITKPILKLFGKYRERQSRKVIKIDKWAPSKFNINVFCFFSPVHVLLLKGIPPESWYYFLPALFFGGLMARFTIHKYEELLTDTRIIHAQVFKEYEADYVRPLTQKRTVETGIGTEDAEWERRETDYMLRGRETIRQSSPRKLRSSMRGTPNRVDAPFHVTEFNSPGSPARRSISTATSRRKTVSNIVD